jgi:hypothetical protein
MINTLLASSFKQGLLFQAIGERCGSGGSEAQERAHERTGKKDIQIMSGELGRRYPFSRLHRLPPYAIAFNYSASSIQVNSMPLSRRTCHSPEEVIGSSIMFDLKAAFAVSNTTTTTRPRQPSARIPASP